MTTAGYVEVVPWSERTRLVMASLVLAGAGGTALLVARVPPVERSAAVLASVPAIAVLAGVAVVFRELRIVLDDETLTAGFGPFRRRVPLPAITRCEPLTYRWLDWGGWGIRWRPGGTLYNVPGDHGQAVQLTLANNRRFLFSSREPQAWCERLRTRYPAIQTI
jgi:hypothetical protein